MTAVDLIAHFIMMMKHKLGFSPVWGFTNHHYAIPKIANANAMSKTHNVTELTILCERQN